MRKNELSFRQSVEICHQIQFWVLFKSTDLQRNLFLLNRLDLGHSSSLELLKCLGTKNPTKQVTGKAWQMLSLFGLHADISGIWVPSHTSDLSVNWKREVPVKQIWKCEIVVAARDTVLITSSRSGHHPQILKGLSWCSLKCNTSFFFYIILKFLDTLNILLFELAGYHISRQCPVLHHPRWPAGSI